MHCDKKNPALIVPYTDRNNAQNSGKGFEWQDQCWTETKCVNVMF
jgi:hypothetical protein